MILELLQCKIAFTYSQKYTSLFDMPKILAFRPFAQKCQCTTLWSFLK